LEEEAQPQAAPAVAVERQQVQSMDVDHDQEQVTKQQQQDAPLAEDWQRSSQEQQQKQQEQQPEAVVQPQQLHQASTICPKAGLGTKLVISVKGGGVLEDAVVTADAPKAELGQEKGMVAGAAGKQVASRPGQRHEGEQQQQRPTGSGPTRRQLQPHKRQEQQQEQQILGQHKKRPASALRNLEQQEHKQQQKTMDNGRLRHAVCAVAGSGEDEKHEHKQGLVQGLGRPAVDLAAAAAAAATAAAATAAIAVEVLPAPEVSAASKDTAAAAAAAVAASGSGLVAAGGGAGNPGAFMLLGMPVMGLTPAAAALEEVNLNAPPSTVPMEEVEPNAEAVQKMLNAVMDDAKRLKKKADERMRELGKQWDVYALCLYALSSVRFMEYMDYFTTMWDVLYKKNAVGNLLHPQTMPIYAQTAQMCQMAQQWVSNATGPDVAKLVLRILLERLSSICSLRHLNAQSRTLEKHIQRVKAAAEAAGAHGGGTGSNQQQQQLQHVRPMVRQQQQMSPGGARVHATGAPAAAVAVGGSSSTKPTPAAAVAVTAGLKKGSPDHSMTSGQDTMTIVKLSAASPEQGHGCSGPGASSAAFDLRQSEQLLSQTLTTMLRVTEGIHQNVMRLQQFMESPEVMCNAAAKQAALEVGVLGIDAGMFSVQLVARHTRAAVTEILKILKEAKKS
jgi:hypothetical protein